MKKKILITLLVVIFFSILALVAYRIAPHFLNTNTQPESELIIKHDIKRKDVYSGEALIKRVLYNENGLPKTELGYFNNEKTSEVSYNNKGVLLREITFQNHQLNNNFIVTIDLGGKQVQVYKGKRITNYFPDGRVQSSEEIFDEKYKRRSVYLWKSHYECIESSYDVNGDLSMKNLKKYDEHNNLIYEFDLLDEKVLLIAEYDKLGNQVYAKTNAFGGDWIQKWERSYIGGLIGTESEFFKNGEHNVFELSKEVSYKYDANKNLIKCTTINNSGSGTTISYHYKGTRLFKEEERDLQGVWTKTKTYRYNLKGFLSLEKTKTAAGKEYKNVYKYYQQ